MPLFLFFFLLFSLLSPSCGNASHPVSFSHQTENEEEISLSPSAQKALQSLCSASLEEKKGEERESMRNQALSNTARALGFQEGFRFQYEELLSYVHAHKADLNKIFDFRRLLIDDCVLPPVILATGPVTSIESPTLATSIEAQYRIIEPARIVSQPPTWESYLWAETEVLRPNKAVRPRNSGEEKRWKTALEAGFREGMSHAFEVFDLSFAQLVADYRGILRFKLLASQGLVSIPVLARGELGIQVGDTVLTLDQKIFRITSPSSFRKKGNASPKGKKREGGSSVP